MRSLHLKFYHQQLRIAQNYKLIDYRFSLSQLLLTPLATFGCESVSIINTTLKPPQHSKFSLDCLVLNCGSCNASISFMDVLSRIEFVTNVECTAEFLKVLAKMHALECIGHKAAEQLQVDEVMSFVSENPSHQSVSGNHMTSALNYLKVEEINLQTRCSSNLH